MCSARVTGPPCADNCGERPRSERSGACLDITPTTAAAAISATATATADNEIFNIPAGRHNQIAAGGESVNRVVSLDCHGSAGSKDDRCRACDAAAANSRVDVGLHSFLRGDNGVAVFGQGCARAQRWPDFQQRPGVVVKLRNTIAGSRSVTRGIPEYDNTRATGPAYMVRIV